MILDSFRQDVRVGLRVLFKDKTFLFSGRARAWSRHRRGNDPIHSR